jgi:hypothetical protein
MERYAKRLGFRGYARSQLRSAALTKAFTYLTTSLENTPFWPEYTFLAPENTPFWPGITKVFT